MNPPFQDGGKPFFWFWFQFDEEHLFPAVVAAEHFYMEVRGFHFHNRATGRTKSATDQSSGLPDFGGTCNFSTSIFTNS